LKATCKSKGVPYRYGGDEIVILLPNFNSGEAAAFGERLRVQIRKPSEKLPAITATIGVGTFPEPIRDAEEFVKTVDDVLYRAKNNGRDQVCVAEAIANHQQSQIQTLTLRSLSVYMRSDDRVRRMDEAIAAHAGQPFNPAEDASLYVCEKAERLSIGTIQQLQEVVRKHGELSQKLARCLVPTTPVFAGAALSYVLDVAAANRGLEALRTYFGSLQFINTTAEGADEIMKTIELLQP
jgi:Diguanylate cyclase, GGDEF domain